jgi:short-subunit dehydrogenase
LVEAQTGFRDRQAQFVTWQDVDFQTIKVSQLGNQTVSKVKGRIDIVFANACVGEFVPFGASPKSISTNLFNINVRAARREATIYK